MFTVAVFLRKRKWKQPTVQNLMNEQNVACPCNEILFREKKYESAYCHMNELQNH